MSVAKLQVALLGSARSLQRQLDRLADRADTSTPEGLHFVLQGAGCCLYCFTCFAVTCFAECTFTQVQTMR